MAVQIFEWVGALQQTIYELAAFIPARPFDVPVCARSTPHTTRLNQYSARTGGSTQSGPFIWSLRSLRAPCEGLYLWPVQIGRRLNGMYEYVWSCRFAVPRKHPRGLVQRLNAPNL